VQDGVAGFLLPLPDPFDEFFSPELGTADTLLGETPLDHVLSRDAGMVRPWHPENPVSIHPFIATENVLKRIIERVTHMQRAGHVRRRNHHRKI
jgi:hypothetical protein